MSPKSPPPTSKPPPPSSQPPPPRSPSPPQPPSKPPPQASDGPNSEPPSIVPASRPGRKRQGPPKKPAAHGPEEEGAGAEQAARPRAEVGRRNVVGDGLAAGQHLARRGLLAVLQPGGVRGADGDLARLAAAPRAEGGGGRPGAGGG